MLHLVIRNCSTSRVPCRVSPRTCDRQPGPDRGPEREMRSAMSTGSTTATRSAPGNSLRSRDLPVNHRTRSDLRERGHTLWNASRLPGGALLGLLRLLRLLCGLGALRVLGGLRRGGGAARGRGATGDLGPLLGAAGLVVLEAVHVAVLLGAVVAALRLVLRAAARAPAAAPRGLRGVLRAVAPAAVVVLALGVHDQAAAVAVLARGREGLDQALTHPLAGHLHQSQR